MIELHGVVQGSRSAAIVGEPPLRLEQGDVLLFPQGEPHVLSSARGARLGPDSWVASFLRTAGLESKKRRRGSNVALHVVRHLQKTFATY